MANTQVTLTVDLNDKSVVQSATPAVRETIDINLSSRGDSVSANMMVLIWNKLGTILLAQKIGLIDWNTVGAQAVAVNLNTDEMIAEFTSRSPLSIRTFVLQVWDTTQQDMLINSRIAVQNSTETDGIVSPSSSGSSYLEAEPDPETNYKFVNGKFCLWDIDLEGYCSVWGKSRAIYLGPIES